MNGRRTHIAIVVGLVLGIAAPPFAGARLGGHPAAKSHHKHHKRSKHHKAPKLANKTCEAKALSAFNSRLEQDFSGVACDYAGTTSEGFGVHFVVTFARSSTPSPVVAGFQLELRESCANGGRRTISRGFYFSSPIDAQGHFSYTSPGSQPNDGWQLSGQLHEPTGKPGSSASGSVNTTTPAGDAGLCHGSATFSATSRIAPPQGVTRHR